MGDTQGRGWLSCAHTPAIGHTRPESQRPWGVPAPVGQAEPQAKSVGHPSQQNHPGRREKTAAATKGQAGRETGAAEGCPPGDRAGPAVCGQLAQL